MKQTSSGTIDVFAQHPTSSSLKSSLKDPVANFVTIQGLRAVAALLVVIYHFFIGWGDRVDSSAPGVGWENGAAGVDLFFVISGFVMVMSARKLANRSWASLIFLRRRVVRIVPLYWLLTTIKVAAVAMFPALVVRTGLDWDYVVRSYLFLPVIDSTGNFRPVIPVGWTLTYEFLFYLFFAMALKFRAETLRIIVPGLGVIAALGIARGETWPTWTIIFNTIVIEFVFGVALAKWTLQGFRLSGAKAAGLFVGGLIVILSVPLISGDWRFIVGGIPALAVVAGAVSLEAHVKDKLPRWILALGDASYSIYLTHGFVLPPLILLIGKIAFPSRLTELFALILCLLLSSAIGWITFTVVEYPMFSALRTSSLRA